MKPRRIHVFSFFHIFIPWLWGHILIPSLGTLLFILLLLQAPLPIWAEDFSEETQEEVEEVFWAQEELPSALEEDLIPDQGEMDQSVFLEGEESQGLPENTSGKEPLLKDLEEGSLEDPAGGLVSQESIRALLVTPDWERGYDSLEEAWNEAVYAAGQFQEISLVLQQDWVSYPDGSFGSGPGFSIEGSILLETEGGIVNLEANGHRIERQGEAANGGCVFCVLDGTLIIWDAQILGGNSTTDGGGALVLGGILDLENVLLSCNQAENGGGLCIKGGTAYLCNCQIVGNQACSLGGGIYLDEEKAELFYFEPVIIEENLSGEGGDVYETGSLGIQEEDLVEAETPEAESSETESSETESSEAFTPEDMNSQAAEEEVDEEIEAETEEGIAGQEIESNIEKEVPFEETDPPVPAQEESDFVRGREASENTNTALEPSRQVETELLEELLRRGGLGGELLRRGGFL